MNKILVEVSVGELLDKLTILEIKKDKIKDAEKLKFINLEYDSLKEQYDKNVKVDEKIKSLFSELKEINAKLWDIEDNKRQCEKDSKFDDHFILLSREIHFLNDKRASIKLEINNQTGSKDVLPKLFAKRFNQLSTCLGFLSWLPTCAVIVPFGLRILFKDLIFFAAKSIQY